MGTISIDAVFESDASQPRWGVDSEPLRTCILRRLGDLLQCIRRQSILGLCGRLRSNVVLRVTEHASSHS